MARLLGADQNFQFTKPQAHDCQTKLCVAQVVAGGDDGNRVSSQAASRSDLFGVLVLSSSARHKTPAFSTMLLHQLHVVDGHATVHRFAHVVNGE